MARRGQSGEVDLKIATLQRDCRYLTTLPYYVGYDGRELWDLDSDQTKIGQSSPQVLGSEASLSLSPMAPKSSGYETDSAFAYEGLHFAELGPLTKSEVVKVQISPVYQLFLLHCSVKAKRS